MAATSEPPEGLESVARNALDLEAIQAAGAGKAYQAVAQSAALAIQDAVDALRTISATATTASGIALAQFLASGDVRYLEVLGQAQAMVTKAIQDLDAVGTAAANVLNQFPLALGDRN